MRKRSIVTAVGASVIGAGAASYFLMNENQKEKLRDRVNSITNKFTNAETPSTFEKAGRPDEIESRNNADMDNANMVSEGSQYGVQYYNEHEDEKEFH